MVPYGPVRFTNMCEYRTRCLDVRDKGLLEPKTGDMNLPTMPCWFNISVEIRISSVNKFENVRMMSVDISDQGLAQTRQ